MTPERKPAINSAVPYILAGCTAVSVLSTDLIVPSIPDLPEAFDTTIPLAQMTVSFNLAAYAVAQLVHGPLADAIGRRRLLLAAFSIFILFSLFCAMATSIEWLLLGRFLQGLMSSVPSVVIILIIRELYDPQKALKVMALYGATLGLAPALGPLVGGYLHVWYGWYAGFLLIAALTVAAMLAVLAFVPESLKKPKPLNLAGALADYGHLLTRPAFLMSTVGTGLLFSVYFAYITTAPVVFIDILGMATERYGLTHLAIVLAFIFGNLLANRLSASTTAQRLLRVSAIGMVVSIVFLAIPILSGTTSIRLIVGAMALYGVNLALLLAAGPLVVLSAADETRQGAASALLGSFQLGMAALAGYLCARFFDGTAAPMAVIMLVLASLGAVLVWLHQPGRLSPGSLPAD